MKSLERIRADMRGLNPRSRRNITQITAQYGEHDQDWREHHPHLARLHQKMLFEEFCRRQELRVRRALQMCNDPQYDKDWDGIPDCMTRQDMFRDCDLTVRK